MSKLYGYIRPGETTPAQNQDNAFSAESSAYTAALKDARLVPTEPATPLTLHSYEAYWREVREIRDSCRATVTALGYRICPVQIVEVKP